MSEFRFSKRSLMNLKGVHPDLTAVVVTALYRYTEVDFAVTEGVRSETRQRFLVNNGHSQTMNSKHLKQQDTFGHAVDLAPYVDGGIPWSKPEYFRKVANAVKAAAEDLDIKIVWGGDWESFIDMPHFQLEV